MIERLRWQVRTCEGWIANADAKAAVIVGLNGALVAGVLAGGRGAVTGGLAGGWATQACDTVFLAAVAWSILWAGLTVLPNVSGGPSGGSVLEFAEVERLSLEDFRKASRALVGPREIEALDTTPRCHPTQRGGRTRIYRRSWTRRWKMPMRRGGTRARRCFLW